MNGAGARTGAVAVSERALQRLVALVREETGNAIPRARHGFLVEIASRRTRAHGFDDASDYAEALARGELEGEWEQLVSLVTVKESYFFRAPQQFAAIERHVLPRLLRAVEQRAARAGTGDGTLRIWSAASARGEEPATLAMILAEHEALATRSWTVVATDLDRDALAAAERGLYGERAVAQVPERLLARWFSRRGELYELDPAIRRRIDYRTLNLSRPPYRELPPEPFDLVLLRNVLIYFQRPLQRRVVSEVIRRMAPEAYLFLGASETLWQIFDRLAPVDLGQCFAYRHPEAVETATAAGPRSGSKRPASAGRPRAPHAPSSGEPATGAAPPRSPTGSPAPFRPPRTLPDSYLRPVTEPAPPPLDEPTVSDEVRAPEEDHPPPPPGGSAQDLLLRAAAELGGNHVDAAARLAAEARGADPSEPAVYALQGFLHDLQGASEEASEEYRAALYLDPGLYQVRVLLGNCLARLGHRGRAEREYRQVLALLDRGGARDLVLLEDLPFPNRTRATRICRRGLGRG